MTQRETELSKSIINIISKEYSINLCSSVSDVKEAVDVASYMMKKHLRIKNIYIAKILNRSKLSDFATKAMHNIEERKQDKDFAKKLSLIEIKFLENADIWP